MQINAAMLIASQQSASPQRAATPGFAQAANRSSAFEVLPLKQAAPEKASPAAAQGVMRPGSTLDIKV